MFSSLDRYVPKAQKGPGRRDGFPSLLITQLHGQCWAIINMATIKCVLNVIIFCLLLHVNYCFAAYRVSVINRCEKGFFFSKNFFGLCCSLHDPPNIYFCIYHGTRLFFPPDFWWIALKWPIFSVFQWDLNDSMQATWFDWAKCLFFLLNVPFYLRTYCHERNIYWRKNHGKLKIWKERNSIVPDNCYSHLKSTFSGWIMNFIQ